MLLKSGQLAGAASTLECAAKYAIEVFPGKERRYRTRLFLAMSREWYVVPAAVLSAERPLGLAVSDQPDFWPHQAFCR